MPPPPPPPKPPPTTGDGVSKPALVTTTVYPCDCIGPASPYATYSRNSRRPRMNCLNDQGSNSVRAWNRQCCSFKSDKKRFFALRKYESACSKFAAATERTNCRALIVGSMNQ